MSDSKPATIADVERIATRIVRTAIEAAQEGTMASVQATGKPDLDMALSYALATLPPAEEEPERGVITTDWQRDGALPEPARCEDDK